MTPEFDVLVLHARLACFQPRRVVEGDGHDGTLLGQGAPARGMARPAPRRSGSPIPSEILRDGTTRGIGDGIRGRCSASVSFVSSLQRFRRIPHQTGIETFRGQHRQDHDAGEGDGADAGLYRGEVAKLDQADQDRDHEHVDHRPAADEFDDAVEHRAVAQPATGCASRSRPASRSGRSVSASAQSCWRRTPGAPAATCPHAPTPPRRSGWCRACPAERDHRHHRIEVGRNVQDGGGQQQRPGARDAVRLAGMQGTATTRALCMGSAARSC